MGPYDRMSTRPYATTGGLRIRQIYNNRVMEAKARYVRPYADKAPTGASTREWNEWRLWGNAWLDGLLATRNALLDAALETERKKKSLRKSERKAVHDRRNRNR